MKEGTKKKEVVATGTPKHILKGYYMFKHLHGNK